MRTAHLVGGIATLLVALAPATAQAATWTVNTTSDPPGAGCAPGGTCSIRQALTVAGPGDTIVIPPSSSHYDLTEGHELTVANPVTIQGADEGATVIDAGGGSRVMTVSTPAGTSTSISGLTLTGGSVTGAGMSQGGGGLLLVSGALALNGVSVSGNSISIDPASGGDGGGGILDLSTGSLTLTGGAVDANTATITGGGSGGAGILDLAGPLALSGTSVDGNSLSLSDPTSGTDGGGGIYVTGGAPLTVTGSTIAANNAQVSAAGGSSGGAGIYDAAGSSTYVNDTFSADALNVSQGSSNGGGALFHEGGPGTISDATIAQNSANAAGGGIFDNAGAYTLKNTIVAQNGTGCAGPGGIISAGFNLEGSNTCNLTMPTDLQNTNPRLGPLAGNGGATLTHALTPASPAIDAGSCTDASGAAVSSDERGVARPQPSGGRCDIGAFEYQPASPAPLIVGGSRPVVLSSSRAQFAGALNPGGLPTTARFEYGLDARYRPPRLYDHVTRAVRIAGGYAPATVSVAVSGLVPAALYHVRLVVANSAGTAVGPDQTFVTAVDRPPPAPVLGRYINAAPAGGLVRVLIGRSFVPLTEPRRLPVRIEFDARQGTVVVSAAGVRGIMTATFTGAVFRLGQPAFGPNRGLATASLADGAFRGVPAYAGCGRRTSRVLQTLHANVSGRFRVSGRYSSGTARAGVWATTDRCDGTVTYVRRGPVQVTNLRRHVTLTLRSGRGYLARR
jgi:hypothetical protein